MVRNASELRSCAILTSWTPHARQGRASNCFLASNELEPACLSDLNHRWIRFLAAKMRSPTSNSFQRYSKIAANRTSWTSALPYRTPIPSTNTRQVILSGVAALRSINLRNRLFVFRKPFLSKPKNPLDVHSPLSIGREYRNENLVLEA